MRGNIFEIQHFSVHDGPGIRTTVFLKGCQLSCLWCHNPESIQVRPSELAYVDSKCVCCGVCFAVCPAHCHRVEGDKHVIDRQHCTFCGKCIHLCAGKALTLCGQEGISAEEVMEEVLADRRYYAESEGGITLSGGEPMMQADFVLELTSMAKQYGIHVAMETNACYDYQLLKEIKENVDLFLVDWKLTDPQKHMKYTGASNVRIYENIRKLHDEGRSILLRCPIIPGLNDTEDHFKKIAQMTAEMKGLIGAELLPYHNLGVGKIEKFGLEGQINYMTAEKPSKETVNRWIELCTAFGGRIINER